MRLVKFEFEFSGEGFGFFIFGLVCLVKTAARVLAELVFCENAKMFPLERECG